MEIEKITSYNFKRMNMYYMQFEGITWNKISLAQHIYDIHKKIIMTLISCELLHEQNYKEIT